MSEWKKVKLGDCCSNVTSGGTPLSSRNDYYNPPTIPWLKTKEVNYNRIYDTEFKISQNGLDNSSAKLIPKNSVIIAMYGQGDTAGRVAINKIPLCTNQACCNLIIDINIANYEFIYYLLCTKYNRLVSLKNGGAQPNLNAKLIKDFNIEIPVITIQNRIAEILSRYDSLIENYQKQIKLLEESAQRLYKEWFVDLRFPGHENTKIVDGVPEGWSYMKIKDRYKTVLGGTPSRSINNYWGGDISWINSGEINKLRIINPSEKITIDGYNNSSTKLMPIHTTILAITGATLGQVSYTEIETCANQSVVGIIDEKNTTNEYLYLNIYNNIHSMINKATGGAQQHINKDIVNDYCIMLPNEDILIEFRKKIKPVFNAIKNYLFTIEKRSEARDRRLPKLMSGEIGV